ncbi:hypothetical protein PRZ48_010674 [Zasmidium cellare]|uniref:Uncharacterized protein n=1 Tax=Zasmidium cellare TaxID=395010 RepID=A0ABR0E9B0_ZASCE|nr:hypothetical protein PRZ48_010674 [Zasmidium cellare]
MADSPFIEDPILRAQVFREYPYDFTYRNWHLITLEIEPKINLQKTTQWHTALRRLSEETSSDTVLWSRDLEQTHCVIVLGKSKSRQVSMAHFPESSNVEEVILIEGDTDLVTSPFLSNIDLLLMRVRPGISHDPPVELAGCARGFTDRNDAGMGVIAAMFNWVGLEERARLIDPAQQSFGGASEYEENIAQPIKTLKAQGVSVTAYLLKLQWWSRSTAIVAPKRHCIIF